MSELPGGWAKVNLATVAEFEMGQAPPGNSCNTEGIGTVFVKAGEFGPEYPITREWTTQPLKFAARGDVLICVVGATSGKLNLGIDCAIGRSVAAIRPSSALSQKALYRQLQLQVEQLRADSTGTAQGVISKQMLADIQVVVPPAPEQTRIANQLDTLLARIQACQNRLDAIPALLKRFRQAVLGAAVSGELLADPSTAEFPMCALGAVLAEPLRNGKSVRDGDGLPVLRLTALKAVNIDLSETKTGDWAGVSDIKRFLVQNGDYLVSRGNGSKELVGRGGLVTDCSDDIAFPDTMIRMRPDKTRLLPDYLKHVWSSQFVRRQIEQAAKTTAGIWKVSQPDLEGVRFPLPTLNEQAEIVRRVEALFQLADRIEARHAAAVAQAQRLTPLTLAKAFRGELVPQDPADEPASALLQRLAKAQAVAAQPKAPRGRPGRKKPGAPAELPSAQPYWAALPADVWAADLPADEHMATAVVTAVLKAWGQPMPQDQARLAAVLCLQPRLATAALPAVQAAQWCRLVGAAAQPLPTPIASLRQAINTPWRNALRKMRARGDLLESGHGPQDTWALAPGAYSVDTAGWPDGRAAWVVGHLRSHGMAALLPSLTPEVSEFIHARAA